MRRPTKMPMQIGKIHSAIVPNPVLYEKFQSLTGSSTKQVIAMKPAKRTAEPSAGACYSKSVVTASQ
ncbi:MAG: hypothetical protein OHK0029_07650 [Armatimonadaceae bacterium]